MNDVELGLGINLGGKNTKSALAFRALVVTIVNRKRVSGAAVRPLAKR
jgi:hypothetical protein